MIVRRLAVSITILANAAPVFGRHKDDDFKYPKKMPTPPMMWVEGFASRLHAQNVQKFETPIQVWQTHRLDQAMWNCIATYHKTALNAITKKAPSLRADEMYHDSYSRALCMIHAVNKLTPELIPISASTISDWLNELGLDSSILSDGDAEQLASIDGNQSPRVLGSLVAAEIIFDMQTDGWNYNGNEGVDGPCTANCRPFTDTHGYSPDMENPTSWKPLEESDDLGFFYRQEHVTPHIGFNATPVVLSKMDLADRELGPPNYVYETEAENVIREVEDLSESNYKKAIVKFMDNKVNIAGGMITQLREKYNLSLEAQVFYHYGYTSTELDTIILAWKEKVRHDLVRPTTIVQALGAKIVNSFAGEHEAKDWVPFIRVMPHAEYPSGSACLCHGIAQYVDAFVSTEYNIDSVETTWQNLDNIQDVTFNNMTELAQTCGDSRLWGGMHFEASVKDSYRLCDGIGTSAYKDLMHSLLGDGVFKDFMDAEKVVLFGNGKSKSKSKKGRGGTRGGGGSRGAWM